MHLGQRGFTVRLVTADRRGPGEPPGTTATPTSTPSRCSRPLAVVQPVTSRRLDAGWLTEAGHGGLPSRVFGGVEDGATCRCCAGCATTASSALAIALDVAAWAPPAGTPGGGDRPRCWRSRVAHGAARPARPARRRLAGARPQRQAGHGGGRRCRHPGAGVGTMSGRGRLARRSRCSPAIAARDHLGGRCAPGGASRPSRAASSSRCSLLGGRGRRRRRARARCSAAPGPPVLVACSCSPGPGDAAPSLLGPRCRSARARARPLDAFSSAGTTASTYAAAGARRRVPGVHPDLDRRRPRLPAARRPARLQAAPGLAGRPPAAGRLQRPGQPARRRGVLVDLPRRRCGVPAMLFLHEARAASRAGAGTSARTGGAGDRRRSVTGTAPARPRAGSGGIATALAVILPVLIPTLHAAPLSASGRAAAAAPMSTSSTR